MEGHLPTLGDGVDGRAIGADPWGWRSREPIGGVPHLPPQGDRDSLHVPAVFLGE
jgi:hypothetical protein